MEGPVPVVAVLPDVLCQSNVSLLELLHAQVSISKLQFPGESK